MNDTKHTPGPSWRVERRVVDRAPAGESGDVVEYRIHDATGDTLLVAFDPEIAALASSAPDLLAACERALDYLEDEDGTDERRASKKLRDTLSAAIARAKGKP